MLSVVCFDRETITTAQELFFYDSNAKNLSAMATGIIFSSIQFSRKNIKKIPIFRM